MKLSNSILLLVLTAGFAALAVTSAVVRPAGADDGTRDVDAWFV